MTGRVVMVTASVPDHDGTGGQLRQAHLLDAVAAHADVVLVTAGSVRDDRVRHAATEVVEVPVHPTDRPAGWLAKRTVLVRGVVTTRSPYDTFLLRRQRAALSEAAARVVTADDVVVVEHLELAPLAASLPTSARRVLTIHHASARQARQRQALATTTRETAWWRMQAARTARAERDAGRRFDTVVAVSDLDAAHIACPTVVVDNGVAIPPAVTPPPGTGTVVFTGTLDYDPNVDGLQWFVERSWPAIRAAVPTATLAIVGRSPTPTVIALARSDGVAVHPDVPTIAPWLSGADVAVVPLRLGGGTRIKALEAMAAGRPVVGTSVGLEGLQVEPGVHAAVADDPAGLAKQVVRVLTDTAEASRLAAAGRAFVAAHHDWHVIGQRFARDVLGLGAPARDGGG